MSVLYITMLLVSFTFYHQDMVENLYTHFQQKWETNCCRLLELHFPSLAYWKSLKNKSKFICKQVHGSVF